MAKQIRRKRTRSWDPLASWYDGWVGKGGSKHHNKVAIPVLMELLDPKPNEKILDMGCGQGVMFPHITKSGAKYTGFDLSKQLISKAKEYHKGDFFVADAANLQQSRVVKKGSFDAAFFMLSIQDIDDLKGAINSAAWATNEQGRVVLLMLHPAFRIPRQSGWGFDERRKLQYRRIDSYLSTLNVPLKSYPGQKERKSISYHRPLQEYINTLGEAGFAVDKIIEAPTYKQVEGKKAKAENRANQEIPLFLGIRAKKVSRRP